MIKICLTHFTYGPWVKVTINAFSKALSYFEDQFDIDIIEDIHKKNILLFLLVLIHSKKSLDPQKYYHTVIN